MRIRIAFIAMAVLLGLAQTASAERPFPVVVKAYESDLRSLRLPGSTSGTLSFKACSECDYKTVRVSPNTRYEANGEVYPLADFRQALAALDNRSRTAVTVKHHLESNLITAVRVTSY
jgi:hypothetical protein